MKEKFDISGMTCAACVAHVQKAVEAVRGTSNVNVNLLTHTLTLDFDREEVDAKAIISAVERAGYGATLSDKANRHRSETDLPKDILSRQAKSLRHRLVVSVAFGIPLLYLSMGTMWGLPVPSFLQHNTNPIAFAFTQLLLTLPIILTNKSYYTKGYRGLLNRTPNMDTLIAIGSTAALLYGIWAIYMIGHGLATADKNLVERYSMDLYFESAAMILMLITVGKYIETISKSKTGDALEKLMKLSPATALVERNGEYVELPVDEVKVGDMVLVKSGGAIPVDGVVVEGSASVDESAITGESMPTEKSVGSKVIQATVNRAGFIRVEATQVGNDTVFAEIIRLVEEAATTKAPIAKLADRVSGIFVPIVIAIAIVTAIVWLALGQTFEFALSSAITVLIISCPCALGLATPVAIMVGTGKGAENGILFKSGEALEIAHNVECVVFDKTGTITEGKPKVNQVFVYDNIGETELLTIAYSLEALSEHPLAEAVVEYSKSKGIVPNAVEHFVAIAGMGVVGEMGGARYIAGNSRLMEQNGIDTNHYSEKVKQLTLLGNTTLIFAKDNNVIGLIAVADNIKTTSAEAVASLHAMNISTVMLTGDNCAVAKNIADKVGISRVVAEVLPQDKERTIADIMAEGKTTAMVGDGINDAPALMRADVGIAIGDGTDIAIDSADVVLMKNDLLGVASSIRLSRAVIRNIKQNLFWAFFYNAIGIPLAAGVFYPALGIRLTPIFGAVAMSLSSIFVITNALRLKRFKPYKSNKQQIKKEKNTMNKKIVKIEGMMCQNCVKHVQKALDTLGLTAVVSLDTHSATIENPTVSDEAIIKAIVEAGYKVTKVE